MEKAIVQDENGLNQIEFVTMAGFVEVSKRELSLHFGLTEESIHLHQVSGDPDDGLYFDLASYLREQDVTFHLDLQFGKVFIVRGDKVPCIPSQDEVFTDLEVEKKITGDTFQEDDDATVSIVQLLRNLPLRNSLRNTFMQANEIKQVSELPNRYDGNIMFELPYANTSTRTIGMESKLDGHTWTNEMTSNISGFEGVVRYRKCGGHLQCLNNLCSGLQRSKVKNEKHWTGRLTRVCPEGSTTEGFGSLKCFYCRSYPTCIAQCTCKLVLCFPNEIAGRQVTRGVIHIGHHMHPVAEGVSKQILDNVHERVSRMVSRDIGGKPRSFQLKLAKEIVMESCLFQQHEGDVKVSDRDLSVLLAKLAPTLDNRRLSRWRRDTQVDFGHPCGDFEALLKLKSKLMFDYFQSIAFPGQIELSSFERCHVFKMSTQGPGNGVELVNKMRPKGELGGCWVFFDFVKRMHDWTTMACHVYNPFVREMQTIAIGDFKVEDTESQILFWTLLNMVMEKEGYKKACFKGFMADEAQANWRAVRTVFNGGPENVMVGRERSCSFHWEQSMHHHAKKCIPSYSQEEFKSRCHAWKAAPSEEAAEQELDNLWTWLQEGHADRINISALQTWLIWWHARVAHWGEYMVKVRKSNMELTPAL